jgi:hypothetical protein
MNRRKFLAALPATAALRAVPELPKSVLAEEHIPLVQERTPLLFVSPWCINGTVARILMPPQDEPPLPQSSQFNGLRFTGKQSNYLPTIHGDTWYPSWAKDGKLYSSYTDGSLTDAAGDRIEASSGWRRGDGWFKDLGIGPDDRSATTGNAVLTGDDPFHLSVRPLGALPARQSAI